MTRFHHDKRSGRHKRPKVRGTRATLIARVDVEPLPLPHRRVPFDLASRCPRLALAHAQRRAELEAGREARRRARRRHLDAEWAVAHRELQLVRAQFTGNSRYIREREILLAIARARLVRAERAMDLVGA